MPKTDHGQPNRSSSEEENQTEEDVTGRYPTSSEREESVERAREVKNKHDRLFRRLAGKDDE